MRNALIAVLLVLVSISSAFATEPIRRVEGLVTKVSDGDTIHLEDNLGTTLKIRMYGIDAPETEKSNKKTHVVSKAGQPHGEESFRALESMIGHKKVKVDVMAVDKYKRTVGIIWLDGKCINQAMVADGHAWAYRQYLDRPYASEYIRLEEQARGQKLGLWVQGNSQPPWEFRKSLKKGKRSKNSSW